MEQQTKSYKSLPKLFIFAFIICLGWVNLGFIIVLFNASSAQVIHSLNWPQSEVSLYSNLTSTVLLLAIGVATGFSGILIPKSSRRNQLIFADFLTIIGGLFTLSSSFSSFIFGRFLLGLAGGMNCLVCSIYVREMSPPDVSGKLGCFNKIGCSFGIMLCFIFSLWLPTTPEDGDIVWMVIFLVPGVLSGVRILALFFIYTNDSPKYYILQNREEDAMKVIKTVYQEDYHIRILHGLKREQYNEKSLSFKEMYTKYKKQIWVCLMLCFLAEMTGLNAVNFYSTQIMLGADAVNNITPAEIIEIRFVNIGMGLLRTLTAFSATSFLDKFGRRALYMIGDCIVALSMGLLAVSMYFGIELLSKGMVLFFAFGISVSYGLINPVYYAECLPYKALGLILIVDSSLAVLVVSGFNIIANDTFLGLTGGLGIFCLIGVWGLWGVNKYVKETKGLTMDQIYDVFRDLDDEEKIRISMENFEGLATASSDI